MTSNPLSQTLVMILDDTIQDNPTAHPRSLAALADDAQERGELLTASILRELRSLLAIAVQEAAPMESATAHLLNVLRTVHEVEGIRADDLSRLANLQPNPTGAVSVILRAVADIAAIQQNSA